MAEQAGETGALFDATDTYAWASACGQYRYTLGRVWEPRRPLLTFVMLNPSIADARDDDPTIRKCRGFAERLGFGGIHVVNLYAFRATKPPAMWAARTAGTDIVGPENDDVLRAAFSRGDAIAAWGANAAKDPLRVQFVSALARAAGSRLQALSVTKSGAPGHPLMLGYSSTLRPWPDRATHPTQDTPS
jgi:hypothetical protein